MSANTSPIFGLTPRVAGITTGTSANTNKDGTGTVATVITAGSNGSKINRIFFQHMGSNTDTVVRVFVNNGSTNVTATNNYLIHEEAFAAWSNSEAAASTSSVWYCDLVLPAGYKINVTTATAIASGIMVTAEGSDY
jgi:hypothetical protein